MRLSRASFERLSNFAARAPKSHGRNQLALIATLLIWFGASQAQAQTLSVTGISTTPNCDAVTGVSLSGSGAVTVTDGNGTLVAWASSASGLFIPFEQPSNNATWTVTGATPSVIIPSTFAPQCAPPSLTVSGGNFNARIMAGGSGAPPTGAYAVSNAGGSAVYLAATPYFPNGTPFLSLSTLPTLGPAASSGLVLSLNSQALSLPPGKYTASIDFSNAADLSLVTTRQVQLTVVSSLAHDYNGDGFGDIAWRDGSGDLAMWLIQGTAIIASGSLGPVPASTILVGQRDFDGDTKTDWLMRDASGSTSIWFLNGTQLT
jgi:hypothetical protein